MLHHNDITDADLMRKVRQREIYLGGNCKLKIYGTLQCASGKRMLRSNRVFFTSKDDALQNGYRPCGHCMKPEYKKWKDGLIW